MFFFFNNKFLEMIFYERLFLFPQKFKLFLFISEFNYFLMICFFVIILLLDWNFSFFISGLSPLFWYWRLPGRESQSDREDILPYLPKSSEDLMLRDFFGNFFDLWGIF